VVTKKAVPKSPREEREEAKREKWLLLIKGAWRERLANLFGRKDHYNFTQVGHYPMIKYRLQYRIPQLIHDSCIEQCNSRWKMYYFIQNGYYNNMI